MLEQPGMLGAGNHERGDIEQTPPLAGTRKVEGVLAGLHSTPNGCTLVLTHSAPVHPLHIMIGRESGDVFKGGMVMFSTTQACLNGLNWMDEKTWTEGSDLP